MFGFIDVRIEKMFKRYLHKRRDKVIERTVKDYIAKNNPDAQTIEELRKSLDVEIQRVFAIADSSIIHARIMQARFAFWMTAIVSTVITLAVASYPPTAGIAPFFAPLISSFIAWVVYLVTIPANYNGRVQGAIDSTLVLFEIKQQEKQKKIETCSLQMQLDALQEQINTLHDKLKSTKQYIDENKLVKSIVPGATMWQSTTDDKIVVDNPLYHVTKYSK